MSIKPARSRRLLGSLVTSVALVSLLLSRRTHVISIPKRLLLLDPKSVEAKSPNAILREVQEYKLDTLEESYNLPENEWCSPPQLPPIDYETCDKSGKINFVPMIGGLTNTLKFILLSAIRSLEDGNKCFFFDDAESIFSARKYGPFFGKYFERIGLAPDSDAVQSALKQRRIRRLSWRNVWDSLILRRVENTTHNVRTLGYEKIEGHELKRKMMRRIWRPLSSLRNNTCKALEQHIRGEEYIGISIREGDKSTEGVKFVPMQQYIEKIEEVAPLHFDGKVPLIFVATDTCEPLERLRKLRPDWRIVSECDHHEQHGFQLLDHWKWTREQLDDHYSKFFVELFALAGAKVWIGVAYTNVSWWVYFMRKKTEQNTFYVLKTRGSNGVPMLW